MARRRSSVFSIRNLALVALLALAGAAMDPAIIAPRPPLSAPPERVGATFVRCGQGPGPACVLTGDTFRMGDRTVRILGIRAPSLTEPACPAEAALAQKSADRLTQLLDSGPFDLIAHRFNMQDGDGRDLRLVVRGDTRLGDTLIAEGLAHRYLGFHRSWC